MPNDGAPVDENAKGDIFRRMLSNTFVTGLTDMLAKKATGSAILAILALTGLYLAPTLAQEPDQPPEQEEAAEPGQPRDAPAESPEAGSEEAATSEDAEPEPDDSDLDDQTYESDDDDFVPTEEIPADEPIPFPSDI
jgi:hypothetical protein